jgi:citronellol/citronellal dehydrogenase
MGDGLKGKTLFITGASRGIGKAIALRAARDGANIVVAAKTHRKHPVLPGVAVSRFGWTSATRMPQSGPWRRPWRISARSTSWSTTPARSC